MRDYQTALTIKDLKEFIKDLPDNSKLMIHETNLGGVTNDHLVEKLLYYREGSIASNELIFKLGQRIEY